MLKSFFHALVCSEFLHPQDCLRVCVFTGLVNLELSRTSNETGRVPKFIYLSIVEEFLKQMSPKYVRSVCDLISECLMTALLECSQGNGLHRAKNEASLIMNSELLIHLDGL